MLTALAAQTPNTADGEWTGAADGLARTIFDALSARVAPYGITLDEASLRGAAVLALERLGARAPAPRLRGTFEPRPEVADAYRAAHERQRQLYRVATGADTT